MPFVSAEALRNLAAQQHNSGRPGTMSEVNGVKGVPVYVTRSLFPSMMIQEGDSGGAAYLRAHPDLVEVVHSDDENLMMDIDRPADYRRIVEMDPDYDAAEYDLPGA
jgi:CTP:molybdopterin cytidylyltransferase MocA